MKVINHPTNNSSTITVNGELFFNAVALLWGICTPKLHEPLWHKGGGGGAAKKNVYQV